MKHAAKQSYSSDHSENLIDRYMSNGSNQNLTDAPDLCEEPDLFAQPIEDEDIFNIYQCDVPNKNFQPDADQAGSAEGPPAPSPARVKMVQMRDKLRQQAQSMSLIPKKIDTDIDEDGMIEITLEHERLVSDTNSKFIFNKLFNKSKKAKDGVDSSKPSWESYKDSLRKKICAQKRKVWDSFQSPIDDFEEIGSESDFDDSDANEPS